MTSEIDKLKHFHIEDYSGIIVVLKVVKDEEMRNNK